MLKFKNQSDASSMESNYMADVSIAEAAKATGKSSITIRGLINQGKLKSYKEGGQHRVSLNDVLSMFGNRSKVDLRIGASASSIDSNDATTSLLIALQSQVKSLENERDYLRQLLEKEKDEKKVIMGELVQRTAEIKGFLENKSGIFKFFGK